MPFTYHLEIQKEQHNWSALQGLPCTSVSSGGFEHFGYLSYSNLWWLFSCVLQLLEMWQFKIKMSSKTEKANRDIASSNVCTYALKAQPVNSLMNTHTSFFILGGVLQGGLHPLSFIHILSSRVETVTAVFTGWGEHLLGCTAIRTWWAFSAVDLFWQEFGTWFITGSHRAPMDATWHALLLERFLLD